MEKKISTESSLILVTSTVTLYFLLTFNKFWMHPLRIDFIQSSVNIQIPNNEIKGQISDFDNKVQAIERTRYFDSLILVNLKGVLLKCIRNGIKTQKRKQHENHLKDGNIRFEAT